MLLVWDQMLLSPYLSTVYNPFNTFGTLPIVFFWDFDNKHAIVGLINGSK